jgi:hypothetical protein
VATLPAPIADFARRNAAGAEPTVRQIRVEQRGEMWPRPGGRPLAFTATQLIAVDRVAFSWRARAAVAGPLSIAVVDEYADGTGALTVRLLGLPVQRARGPETGAGEALRYLAELPFAPPAIARNAELDWREADRGVEVATFVAGERLAVLLEFDAAGDVVRASSAMRKRRVAGAWLAAPWGGEFRDYAALGDLRVPKAAQAYWDLPEGRYVYWRTEILTADTLDRPFGR